MVRVDPAMSDELVATTHARPSGEAGPRAGLAAVPLRGHCKRGRSWRSGSTLGGTTYARTLPSK